MPPNQNINIFFLGTFEKKYDIKKLTLKERNQKFKSDKVNIEFSIFGKILGYNPSLLSMLIFEKQFKLLIQTHKFLKKLKTFVSWKKLKLK